MTMKAIATPPGEPTLYVELTLEERAARDAEVAAWAAKPIDRATDIQALRSYGEKLAFVFVELVDNLLAKGTIASTDFTPAVRQIYQNVKTIADRVKP